MENKSKRTLGDLIDEMLLEKAEKDFFTLSSVVGFEMTTKFVQASDDCQSMVVELTEHVKAGGEPLAFDRYSPWR